MKDQMILLTYRSSKGKTTRRKMMAYSFADRNEVAGMIRAARAHSNMTQENLANAMGIDRTLVNKWENNKSMAATPDFIRVMRVTGYNPLVKTL